LGAGRLQCRRRILRIGRRLHAWARLFVRRLHRRRHRRVQFSQRSIQYPHRRGRAAAMHDPDEDLRGDHRRRKSVYRGLAMAKNAIVSDELASKFATEKDTPYTRWVRSEGLDIIGAHYVPNLHTVELKPWARRGGAGVFINHEASRTSNDCYVCEIPAGEKLAPQSQVSEERIPGVDGGGPSARAQHAGGR